MKLEELKCKNCGAQLKVKEGETQVKCEFCGLTFSVSDAYSDGYNYAKGVLKAKDEYKEEKLPNLNPKNVIAGFCVSSAISFIIFAFVFSLVGFGIYKVYSYITITSFNDSYELHSGKTSSIFLSDMLDEVVTNNKTNNKHKITVIYGDISSMNEDKIKEIRNMLNDDLDYDVSLDYDNKGYINKITISDI